MCVCSDEDQDGRHRQRLGCGGRGEPIHIEIIGLEVIRRKFDDSADMIVSILKEMKHFNDDLFADIIKIEIVEDGKRTEIE